MRRRTVRRGPAATPVPMRPAVAGPLRLGAHRRRLAPRIVARRRPVHVAVRAGAPPRRRGPGGDAGRRLDPALPRPRPRGRTGARPAARQGRGPQPDQLLQGARHVGRGHPRPRAGGGDPLGAVGRKRGLRAGRLRGERRHRGPRVHAPRRQGALHSRVPPARRGGRPGRRADHRRRPDRGRTGPPAGLVRRLHPEGALSGRRQEDHGLRDRRATRLALARLDRLSDRRGDRHRRHLEGVRGARGAGLGEGGRARGW